MRVLQSAWRPLATLGILILVSLIAPKSAEAMPEFARRYNMSCVSCHQAFPRLSEFGNFFASNNFKLPSWSESNTLNLNDDKLALPKSAPLAFRIQSFVQLRESEGMSPATGPSGADSQLDFQAPYLVKLLSSSPISEHISYYFYGIFAEKGDNGQVVIEDAWFRHNSVFDSEIGMQLGQFQISDLMFPREVRMTLQDFYVYRAAGLTYDRGVLFDREIAGIAIGLGAVNGNGIHDNFPVTSPGYARPDRLFDNNTSKNIFGRIGIPLGPIDFGIFGLSGKQKSRSGAYGDQAGLRNTDKLSYGIDISGTLQSNIYWFGQVLWNEWEGFLDADPSRNYQWFGGFLGVDYIANDRWAYSILWNYTEAGDFENTGTIYKGIKGNSIALGAAYYFMRNLKGVIEGNVDLLSTHPEGPPYIGHQSKEHSLLVGFDMAL